MVRCASRITRLMCGLLLLGLSCIASAQQQPVAMVHVAPRASQLPAPGSQLELAVVLKNTKEVDRKLRVFMVKDGQMMNFSLASAKYSLQEEPTYTFQVSSPLGELFYQFVLSNPDGTYSISERYFIRRNCIPNIEPAPSKVSNQAQGDKGLQELAAQRAALARDIESYESVRALLNQLTKLMGDESR